MKFCDRPAAAPRLRDHTLRILGLLCCALLPLAAYAGRAYVSNEDDQSVTVLDTDRGELITTIAVGKRPRGLKLSHDGKRLYVAVSGLPKCPPSMPDEDCAKLTRDAHADGIAVIDTTTYKVLTRLAGGSDPEQFDLSADRKRLFISNEDSASISVLDLQRGALQTQIPVGREPEGVRLSPNGRWLVVTNESDNSITLIDEQSLKVLRTIAVGKRPRDIAFTPDSRTGYVTGEFDASLYRIAIPDGTTAERILQLRKEDRPMSVLLDTTRNRLYVSTGRGGTVAVVALDGPRLVSEVEVGPRPWGIALARDGKHLYTANGPSNDVSVVDLETLKVVRKIPVGRSPWGIVLDP